MAQLVAAAAEVYMYVSPVWLPLAEVIWLAHHDMPVVVWSAKNQRWVVITHAGWFRVRIADGDHPTHRLTLWRNELLSQLGPAIIRPQRQDVRKHVLH